MLPSPPVEVYAAAATLGRPQDLGSDGTPEALAGFARRHGLSAAAPIAAASGRGAARPGEATTHPARPSTDPAGDGVLGVLVLGGERPGRVRPRTLAMLAATADQLYDRLSLAFAAERLADADRELRRLDRLATLGSLTAEIVHEIRNPLVSVKTFLQLLPERESDPDFTEGFLAVAQEELQRIERLLDLVLLHGRPAPHRTGERADLTAALEAVAQLVRFRADDGRVQLVTTLAPEAPAPRLADDALRQVLLNLTLNAVEASPAGGTVALRVARAGRAEVEILVDDEGPGVPEALHQQVTAPFFSTKEEKPGGLGLSITMRIVEEAGGRLHIERNERGGARFRLRLPA